eukprot:TRINITY_DN21754_c0_g1_i1.p3 TRINITY_DN21754_c0_g1~~TRINITY_DN21754_c0_g1_i1.p3  ORF type:complete len:118 (-),score=13.83 TRINITY_DN21754_c0_g1_i1:765-1076(-)
MGNTNSVPLQVPSTYPCRTDNAPVQVDLLVDVSGSMRATFTDDNTDRIEAALECIHRFAQRATCCNTDLLGDVTVTATGFGFSPIKPSVEPIAEPEFFRSQIA